MKLESMVAKFKANAEAAEKKKQAQACTEGDVTQNQVTKSNQLARAYYRFTLNEKRIMEAAISKLDSRWETIPPKVTVTAEEFSKAYGVSLNHAYGHIQDAVTSLMRKVITVKEDPNSDSYAEYTLMSYAHYEAGSGCVEFRVNDLIAHHLIGLRGKYHTSYKLLESAVISSSYTWRFFELLISWAKPKDITGGILAGWLTIEVEELKKMLGAPQQYKWSKFNERVLKVAVKDLSEQANLAIKIETQRKGRSIHKLHIEFAEEEQLELL